MSLNDERVSIMMMYVTLVLALLALLITMYLTLRLSRLARHFREFMSVLGSRTLKKYVRSLGRKRKDRKRYLIFEVLLFGNEIKQDSAIDKIKVENAIRASFEKLFGALDLSRSGLSLVYFDEKVMRGILRFRAPFRTKVIAALGYIRELDGINAMLIPLRVTGTLKKALSKLRGVTY